MFRIGGNTFYNQKNKIPMKIPEFQRSGLGPDGFPNQAPRSDTVVAIFNEMLIPNFMRKVLSKKDHDTSNWFTLHITPGGRYETEDFHFCHRQKKYNPPHSIATALLSGFSSPSSEPPFLTRSCEP